MQYNAFWPSFRHNFYTRTSRSFKLDKLGIWLKNGLRRLLCKMLKQALGSQKQELFEAFISVTQTLEEILMKKPLVLIHAAVLKRHFCRSFNQATQANRHISMCTL